MMIPNMIARPKPRITSPPISARARATTILVVDDEPPIRRFLRTSLTASDYRVVEAEDAAGTMRLLAAEKPDLVILDLGLPDRSGPPPCDLRSSRGRRE
jgi:DNA-binding response OmpR family regulator